MPKRRADPADEIAPRSRPGARRKSNVRMALVVAMLLDLPVVADRDREVVPAALARRGDQRAHVVLGAAAVVVDDVQHARARGPCDAQMRRRASFAQRPQRIGGDVVAHHVEVVRMALEQQRHVALRRARAFVRERAPAEMQDERVVAQHVALAGAAARRQKSFSSP